MGDLSEKLKRLRTEDWIWIIYFFIAGFAILSNAYERDYIINHKKDAYYKEKAINISLFFIAFFIYLYFVLLITQDLKGMEKNFNNPNYRNTFLKLIAALLFLVGGAIYLIQEASTNEEDEIGFI